MKIPDHWLQTYGGLSGAQMQCTALNGSAASTPGAFPTDGTLSMVIRGDWRAASDTFLFGANTNVKQIRLRVLSNTLGRGWMRAELRYSAGNFATSDFKFPANRACHIAIRWNRSVSPWTVEFMVDGVVGWTYSSSGTGWDVTEQAFDLFTANFQAFVGEVKLFNAFLSDTEIGQVIGGETPEGLMAYWDFSEDQFGANASTATDRSGNGYHATISTQGQYTDPTPVNRNMLPTARTYPRRHHAKDTIFSGSKQITADWFGMTMFGYPNGAFTPNASVLYNLVRSHDYNPTGAVNNQICWKYVETANGTYDWTHIDNFVNAHYANGTDILYVLGFPADWAVAAAATGSPAYGGKSNQPPDNNADWIDFCTQVATRYAGKIQYYQIWNEPEQTAGYYWAGTNATPARMAELARLANQTIKAIDPAAKIVSAGSAGWRACFNHTGYTAQSAIWAASDGAGGTFADWIDIAAIHLYDQEANGWNPDLLIDGTYGFRQVLDAAGRSDIPIWCTEFSIQVPYYNTYTELQRKKLLQRTMLLAAACDLERFCWFAWDSTLMGFSTSPGVEKAWIDMRALLLSGPLERVTKHMSGRVSARIGGAEYVF